MSDIREITPAEVAALYGQPYVEPVSIAVPEEEEPAPAPVAAPVVKDHK